MNSVKLVLGGVIFLALAALITTLGTFYTVDAGERAVVLRAGSIIGVEVPGLHFKAPFLDSVVEVSTRTVTLPFPDEPFYSKDQQAATATVSVTFAANSDAVDKIYSEYGSLDAVANRLIVPRVKKQFKEVMGRFNAETAIQERERMGVEVSKAIAVQSDLITIQSVQVENINFSNKYETAIEDRMMAEVGIATQTQNLEKEKKLAEIKVTQQQAEADSKFANLKAEADGIRAKGEAEASAITAKGEALKNNPNLIELIKAERWLGTLPTHVLPNGTVPFLDVAK